MFHRLAALALFAFLLLPAPDSHAQWMETGTPVATAVDYQMNPALISDGAGGAILVWEDGRSGGGYFDIYAQHVDSAGVPTWTYGGLPLCIATDQQLAPVLVSDGFGGAMFFWTDFRAGKSDIYGQRVNAAGFTQWTAGGLPLCTAAGNHGNIAVVGDGNPGINIGSWPGAILAWTDSRISSNNVDIYVQHINGAAAGTWAANGVLLCDAPFGQYAPAIASDATGSALSAKGAIVAWEDYRLGFETPSDIYAGRVTSAGVVAWGTSGVPICTADGGQNDPRIVTVGAGQVIVSWTDSRPTDPGIYAQKLDATGAVLWAANGVSACVVPGLRSQSRIVTDGAGGAILVWMDYRNGNWDLYAQRLGADGARLWGDAGKPVCTVPAQLFLRETLSDGAGGVLVLWEDNREPGMTYAYVQRLDAAGNPLLAPNGVRVATYAANQVSPRFTNAPNGRAIVAWQDWRGTFYDIYANRVSMASTVDVPAGAPGAFRVALAGSHPARGRVRFAVQLPEAAAVTAEVLDPLGRRVRALARGTVLPAGTHQLGWDGVDESGARVAAGVYWLRVSDGTRSAAVKVVTLR